jgi:NAD(P)-dependent dehydrogenase (short-subunit alcohol dehydrogenase family)
MDVNIISVLITGAGSGLGTATARTLAKADAKVVLLDMNLTASAEVAGEIGGVAIRCDVSEGLNVEAAF